MQDEDQIRSFLYLYNKYISYKIFIYKIVFDVLYMYVCKTFWVCLYCLCVYIHIYLCIYNTYTSVYIHRYMPNTMKKKEATDLWVGLLWRGLRQGNLGTTCSAHLEREDNVPTNSWISDCDSEKHWNILCLDFQLGGYHGSLWLGPLRYYNIHMICMTSPTSQVWKITNSVLSGFKFSLCHMIAVWF